MKAILFLYRRNFANRLKKALHKPVTYVYLAFFLLYAFMVPYSFKVMFSDLNMSSPAGMTAVFTVFAFWVIPANLIAYARRKGLLYRKSDIHFLFTSPVGPKKILLYAHLRTLLITFLFNIILMLGGAYIFQVEWWRMALYFLFSIIAENLLEGGIMLLLYGSEKLGERGRRAIVKVTYALVGVLVAMGLYTYIVQGLSFESVLGFLHSGMVQMVPVIGWYIAVIHLLFMGPTAVNVVCSILYFVMLIAVVCGALRMKCTGGFYEDAMKFADDYEEVLASRRQGRTDVKFGKKKKFGKAQVSYRGSGARAIFYRQLLEYKKNRFFIFDISTVISLIAGIGIAYLYIAEGGYGVMNDFIIPAVMAYIIFLFTAYTGKWGKELSTPYTFMIPDSSFHKLWYATLIQHIQALINGCLFTLPGAVVMKMSPLTAVLCILFYVSMSACKLYILAVAQALVGNVLGRTGRQLFQMFLLGIAISVAALGVVAGMIYGSMDLAYFLMIVLLVVETAGFMAVATVNFHRMEAGE